MVKEVDIEKPNWIFIDKKWTLSSKTGHSNKIVWIYEKISSLLIDILYNFTFMLLYCKIGSIKVKQKVR